MRPEPHDAFGRVLRVGDEVALCRVRGRGRRAYQARYTIVSIKHDDEHELPLISCSMPGDRNYGTRDSMKLVRLRY